MDYLKRFLTFNILSIIGYGILGMCIYAFISIFGCVFKYGGSQFPSMIIIFWVLAFIAYAIEFLIYFLLGFLCEFLILFALSKKIKKQVGLNFKNKVYDIMFRLGIFCVFLPITIISTFALWLFLGIIVQSDDSWITFIILCFCMFDIEIKSIFFKKYFGVKTK